MIISNIVTTAISGMISLILLFYLIEPLPLVNSTNPNFKFVIMSFVVGFIVNFFISIRFPSWNWLSRICVGAFLTFLNDRKIQYKIAFLLFLTLVYGFCEGMSRLYFRVIALDVPPVLFSEIMAGMVLSICLIFNHRWIAKKERLLVIPSLRYGFAFVPLTLLILLYALILPNIVCPQMAVWIALGILFIDCIYSTLFWIVKNTLHRLWTRYLQELDRQVTNQNNAAQQDASLTLRGFRHDVKHHLLMLHDLANKSQAQDIIKYLQKIDEAVAISDQSIRSGNSMIDTILNAMIHNAHTQDCSIQVEAHLPTNLQLPIFEINAILSNLFENAIENAAISDEKEIIGSIFLNKGILFIDIVNSTQKEIPFAPDEYPTHKEDPVNHGLGLKIIQQMVDRLDGEMNIQHEKNRFRVTVMLYIQYNTT